ncbi:hypothetical protein [Qipengyuania nanhaisediminis]|uniref:Uncharacterized protein n=1 Tax=Qipengyuania nanhaisediminis TaxID=604088 RepID=A0A1I5KAW0_9SPHN|nr:hypothetical protein [Qipengyuania nanhaisediminis]SFO81751.1 hypothetical protein SAMN04488060_0024 [Qipengyuania nanhaisediminis]
MHDLPNMTAVKALLARPLDPELKTLLADRLADTIHCGLQNYTHILVVEADDTEAEIVQAIGFSPLQTRTEKVRNCLDCDWLEHHDGWWEMLYTVGDDGFAYIVLAEDREGSELARLCRRAEVQL